MAPKNTMKELPIMIVMIITMMEVFAFLAKRMMSGVNITEPTT